jgi:SAM-dependent methyltransferase
VHPTVLSFTEQVVREHGLNKEGSRVLIVGSLDVNGSVRPYFDKTQMVGIDLFKGEGVDHAINAHDLLTPESLSTIFGVPYSSYSETYDQAFDVVACTEMLEHDDEFWKSLYNMGAVLRSGGYLLLTARGARPGIEGKKHGESMWEHAYPDDYYRFMPNAVPKLLRIAKCETVENVQDTYYPGFLALGRKT